MRVDDPRLVKPRNPELTALLGGVCIGAGLIYVERYKTAVASIAIELTLVWTWYRYHILWVLWFLAVLWYWQVWYGYEKAEQFNQELDIQRELRNSLESTLVGKSP